MTPFTTCVLQWPIPTVYPSGAARATRPTPMLPPAPVVFSTTTVCPSALPMRCAMIRPSVSVGPPAENGTTIVTACAGYTCAEAVEMLPKDVAKARAASKVFIFGPPLRNGLSAGNLGAPRIEPDGYRDAE